MGRRIITRFSKHVSCNLLWRKFQKPVLGPKSRKWSFFTCNSYDMMFWKPKNEKYELYTHVNMVSKNMNHHSPLASNMVSRYKNPNTLSSTCSPQWTAGLFCCNFSSFDTWTAFSTSNDWFFTVLCVLLWWILTPLSDLQGRSDSGHLNCQSWTYTPVYNS